MPTSSVQSRISAFESLSSQRPPLQTPLSPRVIPSTPPRTSPSPSPPNLGRKSSLLDLKIDLKDWVLDDGSPPRSNGFRTASDDDALIHFSPPKPSAFKGKAPPLPPRKPSLASLKSNVSSASLPINPSTPTHPPNRRGDSLTVEHTYPPPLDLTPGRGHTHASSVSSFHSVSLSDSSPSPQTATFSQHTTGSSGESFEELSASTALASPKTAALISQDWERAMAQRKPPKLPARPTPPTTTITTTPPPARRPAPPPPPSLSSDRASIASVSSASSRKSVHSTTALTARPTPIPLGPRRRYDALYTSLFSTHASAPRPALLSAPRRRTAAGWRGLSVDLTSPGTETEEEEVQGLPGSVICILWSRSRLPRATLSAIWTECDPSRTGVLDREAFTRGMWRIDEELRRAETSRLGGAGGRRGLR
ncbi:hypothetical protein FB45DRAFT_1057947 [Roridomyces roridus]|uniref:EH domain-containing protein n=1 Tax=Roridomyces roridus TaxID=1738132 RepID=A0AAD7BYI6_9AGAR|nr:hypothetical protein FB45DRAFT_1057947 [Roridomyces roridus]